VIAGVGGLEPNKKTARKLLFQVYSLFNSSRCNVEEDFTCLSLSTWIYKGQVGYVRTGVQCTVLDVRVVVLLLGLDEEVPGVRVDVALHPLAEVHRH
jgi:hypothetical protein